jgi:site-specific DNA-cytosine methylase
MTEVVTEAAAERHSTQYDWKKPLKVNLSELEILKAPYTFVDCQGFAGGFTAGAVLAGMRLVAKREGPGGFGVSLVEANHAFLGDRWASQVGPAEEWEPVKADVVLGTPPCTAFSNMSVGTKSRGMHADINHCMWDLIGYAARVKPAAVMMESVAGAFTNGRWLMGELARTLNEKTGLAYRVTHVLQNNLSVGGCTNRRRYFLVLSQVPFGVERHSLTWLPTVGEAVGDLVNLPLTHDPQSLTLAPTWWSRDLRTPGHTVDGHMNVTSSHVPRLLDLVAEVPWRDGERETDILRRYHAKHGDLPESWHYEFRGRWKSDEPRPTRAQQLMTRDLDPGGFNQLRKWDWDRPGHVITGAGPYMLWHRDDRHMTHRETARLMGFPDAWVVGTAVSDKQLHMHWGKGTSVHPAFWVTTWLRQSLDGQPGTMTGELLDDGSRLIDVSNDWRDVARRQWGTTRLSRSNEDDGVTDIVTLAA